MCTIKDAKELIKSSDTIVITAGAGMGVDSGLPDFRGNEGFWTAYPVARRLGLSFAELANPKWFEEDPYLAWAFYGHRLNLYRNTLPHYGFELILDYLLESKKEYFVVTSNVDGQFQKAGFDETKILEVHGSIHHLQCTDNCSNDIWNGNDTFVEVDMESFQAMSLPRCINCGLTARPNILMFGDFGWLSMRTTEQEERFDTFLNHHLLQHSKVTVIELGAGEAVPTIRYLSENLYSRFKHGFIRINPRDSHIPPGAVAIESGAQRALKQLFGNE